MAILTLTLITSKKGCIQLDKYSLQVLSQGRERAGSSLMANLKQEGVSQHCFRAQPTSSMMHMTGLWPNSLSAP